LAFPSFFVAVTPIREKGSSLAAKKTTQYRVNSLRPVSYTRRNSRRFASLFSFGRASDRDCTVGSASRPLYREALAAFAAPAREDRLTVLGSHADKKAVRPLAAAVVRLESALHGSLTL